jgi:hypothetical protein
MLTMSVFEANGGAQASVDHWAFATLLAETQRGGLPIAADQRP